MMLKNCQCSSQGKGLDLRGQGQEYRSQDNLRPSNLSSRPGLEDITDSLLTKTL